MEVEPLTLPPAEAPPQTQAASTASTTAMTSKSASTMKKRYLGRSLSLTGSLPTWLRGKSSQNDVGGSGGGGLPFQRMLTHLDSTDKNTKKQNPQSTGNNIWTVELPSDNEWDTVITDEEAQQLMCPPSPIAPAEENRLQKERGLQRMHSLHVGPVRLPHPVRMPNGRVRTRTNSESKRACSEDYTKSNTPPKGPSKKDIRSYSLKHGSVLEDYTIFEKEPTIITAAETNNSNNSNKPKVK